MRIFYLEFDLADHALLGCREEWDHSVLGSLCDEFLGVEVAEELVLLGDADSEADGRLAEVVVEGLLEGEFVCAAAD